MKFQAQMSSGIQVFKMKCESQIGILKTVSKLLRSYFWWGTLSLKCLSHVMLTCFN